MFQIKMVQSKPTWWRERSKTGTETSEEHQNESERQSTIEDHVYTVQTRLAFPNQRQDKARTPAQCQLLHQMRQQEMPRRLRWKHQTTDLRPNHGP